MSVCLQLKPVRSLENFSCQASLQAVNTTSDLYGGTSFLGRSGLEEEGETQDNICLISKTENDVGLPLSKTSASSRSKVFHNK